MTYLEDRVAELERRLSNTKAEVGGMLARLRRLENEDLDAHHAGVQWVERLEAVEARVNPELHNAISQMARDLDSLRGMVEGLRGVVSVHQGRLDGHRDRLNDLQDKAKGEKPMSATDAWWGTTHADGTISFHREWPAMGPIPSRYRMHITPDGFNYVPVEED